MNTYDNGASIKVSAAFTNPDAGDAPIDPTAVFVSYTDPSGNETIWTYGVDAELVRTGTGTYEAVIDGDEAGFWHYRWYSTGTGQAAGQGIFYVRGDYTLTPAGTPDQTTGYATCYDENGDPEAGEIVTLELVSFSSATNGNTFDRTARTATSDANGLVQFDGLFQGAIYRARRGTGPWKVFTADAADTTPIPVFLK